jgi:hypothetical protein
LTSLQLELVNLVLGLKPRFLLGNLLQNEYRIKPTKKPLDVKKQNKYRHVKLGNDPNTRAVEAQLIYSSKTTGAFLVQKDWRIFATYIGRLFVLLAPQ